MNKLIYSLLFFCASFIAMGQEAAQQDPPPIEVFEPAAADTVSFTDRKFSPQFQDSYKSEEFVYERKAAGTSQWDRFMAWLGRLLQDIFTFGRKSQNATIVVILIRIIFVLIILFVIYLLVRAILNKEGMWIFGRQRRKIHVEDAMAENIHEMDFGKLVAQTKESNNYRLAVRYYYLWLLKKLSNREIIDWHWDKTNSDYLYEIKDSKLKKDFEYLSYLYDYSWYGEFPLDDAAFGKAEKAFQQTLNTL